MVGVRFRTAEWLRAIRWRKRVEEVLTASGLTFTQWLVLGAIRELLRATEDTVSQNDVAVHLEMHRSTVSDAMLALESKGLVDRGGAIEGTSWRVLLTSRAGCLLAELDPRTDAISGSD